MDLPISNQIRVFAGASMFFPHPGVFAPWCLSRSNPLHFNEVLEGTPENLPLPYVPFWEKRALALARARYGEFKCYLSNCSTFCGVWLA
jgi:hypothetical protein